MSAIVEGKAVLEGVLEQLNDPELRPQIDTLSKDSGIKTQELISSL